MVKQICEMLPLRRSQRLSQKLAQKTLEFSVNNADIMRIENGTIRKPVARGVPLDLSKKSKVSKRETPRGGLVSSDFSAESCEEVAKKGRISALNDISSDNKNCYKRCNKSLHPFKENSSLVAGKRKKICNDLLNNSTESGSIPKPPKQNLQSFVTNFTNSDGITPNKSSTTKKSQEKLIIIKQNEQVIRNKFNNQNKLDVTNTEKNLKKLSFAKNNSRAIGENKSKTVVLNDSNTKSASETKSKKTPSHNISELRKSQKRKCLSDENISKKKTQFNELQLQHIHQNKSEPFTLLDTCTKISNETSPLFSELKKNILQNNSLQLKIETSEFEHAIDTKSFSQFKPHRVLRKATPIIDKQCSSENTENIKLNECKKVKMEIISNETAEGKIHLKETLNNYSGVKTTNPSGQHISEYEFNTNKLKFNGTTVFCKEQNPVHFIQQIKQLETSSQQKTEIDLKNFTINKNYIKCFDRSQFLDKIQNAKNYMDKLAADNNNYSKLNTFEIPPTPAECSQDLLKKSILPDAYPPYFKHQLPPETLLTKPLDLQPHLTSVITPDDTISSELLESSSSSPSLPESLCELFQTKDIKDILKVEKTSYRLYNYHIQALALILNLRLEYLLKVLEKIITISPSVLKKMDRAVKMPFIPDSDIFSTSPGDLWASSGVICNSQSPNQ